VTLEVDNTHTHTHTQKLLKSFVFFEGLQRSVLAANVAVK